MFTQADGVVLNALLDILENRRFDNGQDGSSKTPLVVLFGASNESPPNQDEGMQALYDRFLVRLFVDYINHDEFLHLLETVTRQHLAWSPTKLLPLSSTLQETLKGRLQKVQMGHFFEFLSTLRDNISQHNSHAKHKKFQVQVSDRRWVKLMNFFRVSAWTHGRDQVELADLYLLEHCLWRTQSDKVVIQDMLRNEFQAYVNHLKEREDAKEQLQSLKFHLHQHLWLTDKDKQRVAEWTGIEVMTDLEFRDFKALNTLHCRHCGLRLSLPNSFATSSPLMCPNCHTNLFRSVLSQQGQTVSIFTRIHHKGETSPTASVQWLTVKDCGNTAVLHLFPGSHADDTQQFVLHSDGTIAPACAPDYRLDSPGTTRYLHLVWVHGKDNQVFKLFDDGTIRVKRPWPGDRDSEDSLDSDFSHCLQFASEESEPHCSDPTCVANVPCDASSQLQQWFVEEVKK
mmetsp:Transcript_63876/g.151092  ORF Transcript_63876/g.151092 Transcript_63876/m.151092 type:complete len:456 (-) Transcript_63876:31-1398(-)